MLLVARAANGGQSAAADGTIGHDHGLCIIQEEAFHGCDVVDVVKDLVAVTVDGGGADLRIRAGADTALVMQLAVDEDVVALEAADTRRDLVLIRLEIRSALALELLVEDFDLVGDDELLAGMTDGLVGEYEHRHAILIRQVEGADREVKRLLHGRRRKGDDLIVAMAAVARLHDSVLRRAGRLAGRRAAAHDVDDDQRRLGDDGVANALLHQGEARTGRGRHGTRAAPAGADDRIDGGELVFHLHEHAAGVGQIFGDLRCRSDRIACHEAAARCQRTGRTGLVALHQLRAAVAYFLHTHKP